MIRIKKIILWSNDNEIREIKLNYNGITVLIGDSKAGKSALIPIIDYCMASSDCDIPVGIIRDSCSWFGIVIEMGDSDVLIARKSPVENNVSNEMSFIILENSEIPKKIVKNITRNEVKNYFNEFFDLTNLSIDDNDFTKDYIPSYRDTIGINFYPQDLLLNKNYYFYKQEINIHDKNLKFMFPYFMGVLTMQDVVNKKEYDNINRMILLLNRNNNKNIKIISKWEVDSKEKLLKAMKLGVTNIKDIPESFEDRIIELKNIRDNILNQRVNTTKLNLNSINRELEKLRSLESNLYNKIFAANKKLLEIKRQTKRINIYNKNNNTKNIKMISEWLLNDEYLQSRIINNNDSYAKKIYTQIVNTLKKEEANIKFYDNIKISLEKEYFMIIEEQKKLVMELDYTQECINKCVKDNEDIQINLNMLEELYKYVGEIDNYIKIYEMIIDDSNLQNQINEWENKKKLYESFVNEEYYIDKYQNFDLYLKGTLDTILDNFNVEYKGDQVWFDSKKIEFKFACTKSGVPLSKIGSGSNSVEYHLAMAFLLNIYIQNQVRNKCTFDFIFLDQPSEAYFPTKEENKKEKTEDEKQNDNFCVRTMFRAISSLRDSHCKNLQIIVTEHADEEFWLDAEGKLFSKNIVIIDWKRNGEKLIPDSWIKNN